MKPLSKEKKLSLIGQVLLLLATIVWGSSFTILKDTISAVPAFYVLAIRFLSSGLIIFLIFFKKIIKINRKTLFHGIILGLTVAGAYITQTIGLIYTTPSINAFLTAAYVIITPFLIWLFMKKRPSAFNFIAAVLCMVGIGFIAFAGGVGTSSNALLGEGLTLVSAIFYAFQILFLCKFQEDRSATVPIIAIELLTTGIVFVVLTLIFDLPSKGITAFSLNTEQILKILYLTLACTLFAQAAQIIGQKYTPPTTASVILCLESVFGAVFSVILGSEQLSALLIVGFVIVFIAILLSELNPDFNKILKRKDKENNRKKDL